METTTRTYLGNIVVLAEELKLSVELVDPIFVTLVSQPRHLLGKLRYAFSTKDAR